MISVFSLGCAKILFLYKDLIQLNLAKINKYINSPSLNPSPWHVADWQAHFSKQDMSCSLEKLKNQHLRLHYCRNFSAQGSSFLKHTEKRGAGRHGAFRQLYSGGAVSCRIQVTCSQVNLCCIALVLTGMQHVTQH